MTSTDVTVPIRIDALDDGPSLPVKSGTNGHRMVSVLVENPDPGFSPAELVEMTDVPRGSVGETLSRLEERGPVRAIDGYWAAEDDVASSHLVGYISLAAIEARYGDDAHGRDDERAEDLPHLGENA